ncbi:MAG TPA: isoprenylcysteine carboxylmethyltransferase family protein [Actinomycetota bacterium]|nr:isoprenylcysteine carboxylmethyltransferase family protein [Actinomycetota bacterium]
MAFAHAVPPAEPHRGVDRSSFRGPGVIAPPPLIYLVGLALGFGLEALLPSPALPGVVRWVLGTALLALAVALGGAFVSSFQRARTPIDVRKPARTLVTEGPFRLSRNPGYVAMVLAYAGTALITGTLWTFATLVPTLVVVDRGVIRREERHLEKRFGEEYRRYKARTRRWL